MTDEKIPHFWTDEKVKEFWELMVGIAVLIFTTYTVWKDFSVYTFMQSVFFVLFLLFVLYLFKCHTKKQAESQKFIDNSLQLEQLEEEIRGIKKRLDELEKKS